MSPGWAGLRARLTRIAGEQSAEMQLRGILLEPVRTYVRQVLGSGGGVVLIRAAQFFPRACEIIRNAGGRVGLQRTTAA